MKTQSPTVNNAAVDAQALPLQQLATSVIQFVNAWILFIMQQMHNALCNISDSDLQPVIDQFRGSLDAISMSLSTQIDAQKTTFDKDRTDVMHINAMIVRPLNPWERKDIRAEWRLDRAEQQPH